MPSGSFTASAFVSYRIRHHVVRDHFGQVPDTMVVLGTAVGPYPAGTPLHTVLADLESRVAGITNQPSRLGNFTMNALVGYYFRANAVIYKNPLKTFLADALLGYGAKFTLDAIAKSVKPIPVLSYHSQITGMNYPGGLAASGNHLFISTYGSSSPDVMYRFRKDASYPVSYSGYYADGMVGEGDYVYALIGHAISKRRASDFSLVAEIGSFGTGNDQFNRPQGISTDGTYLYVADWLNQRIVKRLKSDLSYVSKIGSFGSGNDQFKTPGGITTDGTYVYVADRGNHRVVKRLASDLSYVSKIGSFGSGNDQFKTPYDISVTTDGNYLFVADSSNGRIVVRSAHDLSYISQFGSFGTGPNNFQYPSRLLYADGALFVSDGDNLRVVRLSTGARTFTANAVVV